MAQKDAVELAFEFYAAVRDTAFPNVFTTEYAEPGGLAAVFPYFVSGFSEVDSLADPKVVFASLPEPVRSTLDWSAPETPLRLFARPDGIGTFRAGLVALLEPFTGEPVAVREFLLMMAQVALVCTRQLLPELAALDWVYATSPLSALHLSSSADELLTLLRDERLYFVSDETSKMFFQSPGIIRYLIPSSRDEMLSLVADEEAKRYLADRRRRSFPDCGRLEEYAGVHKLSEGGDHLIALRRLATSDLSLRVFLLNYLWEVCEAWGRVLHMAALPP